MLPNSSLKIPNVFSDGAVSACGDIGGPLLPGSAPESCWNDVLGGSSVLNTIGRLRYFLPFQTAATVSWYCVSGESPPSVTASRLPATTTTTL